MASLETFITFLKFGKIFISPCFFSLVWTTSSFILLFFCMPTLCLCLTFHADKFFNCGCILGRSYFLLLPNYILFWLLFRFWSCQRGIDYVDVWLLFLHTLSMHTIPKHFTYAHCLSVFMVNKYRLVVIITRRTKPDILGHVVHFIVVRSSSS